MFLCVATSVAIKPTVCEFWGESMQRGKTKYNIGELADISSLSVKTLRYYDKKGILTPTERDNNTNYRYYSEDQILKALAIREMRLRGFSLEEIQFIMQSRSIGSITENYNKRIMAIREEIAHLQKKLQLAEYSQKMILTAMRAIPDGAFSAHTPQQTAEPLITVEPIEECLCLFTRHRSRIYVQEVFWDRFAEIYRLMDEKGYTACGPLIGVFHEHYTHQFFFEDGDLEILQPITAANANDPDVKTFGGGLMASLVHVGFYGEFLPEYVTLIKWIEENGYEIVGNPTEMYLVEFTQCAQPEEYVTRICFSVKRSA